MNFNNKKQMKAFEETFMKAQNVLSQKLDQMEVTGSAGNGLVEITISGNHDLRKVHIKPECVDPEDVEGLETLIKAAYEDAAIQLHKEMQSLNPTNFLSP